MYAVVDIKGFQYKLKKGETLRVPKFDIEVGKKIKLSDVLFIADGDKYSIGQPTIEGATVEATVTDQGKLGKIIVFKKKRRKDYSVKRGHRQDFTELSIDDIKVSGAKKAKKTAAEKPEEAKVAETKAQEKAPESPKKIEKAKAPEKTAPDTQAASKKDDSAVPSGKTDKASETVKTETKTKKTETKAKKAETKKPDAAKAAEAKSESTDTSE